MSIISYDQLNNLSETSFIGGTDQLWTYTCYQEDGALLTITSGSAKMVLCPYGIFGTTTLEITGTIIDSHHFTIALADTDTISLSGKYIQQIVITDFSGNTFRPGQGTVIILPAIPTS